jgi:hypothetical protein
MTRPKLTKAQEKRSKEKLAELAHSQWSGWMKWMLPRMTDENIKRWKRQMDTPYNKLSEREKDSDRKEADKYLKILAEELAREREKIIRIAWSLAKQGNYKDGLLLVNALKEWTDERISGKVKDK